MQSKLPLIVMIAMGLLIVMVLVAAIISNESGGCHNISDMNCGGYGSAYQGRR